MEKLIIGSMGATIECCLASEVDKLISDHAAAIKEAVEKAVKEERDRVFSICVDKNHEVQLQHERIAELEATVERLEEEIINALSCLGDKAPVEERIITVAREVLQAALAGGKEESCE
jgi:hypothetical protein